MHFLIISVLVITIAHAVRIYRWSLFMDPYEKPDCKNLFFSFSIGYLFNSFLPYKIGDIARAVLAGRKLRYGKGFALASVIVERIIDIITIGALFGIFALFHVVGAGTSFIFYIVLAFSLFFFLSLAFFLRHYLKKSVVYIASLFNNHIEVSILKFFWSIIWSFKNLIYHISKFKMVVSTCLMWFFYFVSYYFFALSLSYKGDNTEFIDIFFSLFTFEAISSANKYPLFFVLPCILLFIGSFLIFNKSLINNVVKKSYINLFPHLEESGSLSFLKAYFSDEKREYISTYFDINKNITILHDYSAGSKATTILCTDGEKKFWRKYAFGADGDKLYEQVKWIRSNSDKVILPDILQCVKESDFCFYDMPYRIGSLSLFDYAHSLSPDNAWNIIKNSIYSLEHNLYKNSEKKANISLLKKYIQSKVNNNINKILNSEYVKQFSKYETVVINGVPYKNFQFFFPYLSENHLVDIFKNDDIAEIHGDLTIENIIADNNESGSGYYIIDPNTGNIHDSPNLDYGKLLQSLHGSYEFLMAAHTLEYSENKIFFTFIKSDAYKYLFNKLNDFMVSNFPEERVRSIYYHEIVHWLRLMPYKIEKNGERCLLFYAGMIIVLNDVYNRFEKAL